jgi:hypothetical protein
MKLELASETALLRFDSKLKVFTELFTAYLETNTQGPLHGQKIVATGPLAPADIMYAAGALPYDSIRIKPCRQYSMETINMRNRL